MIVAHELGHFIAAVSLGVRVEVFSIGFGKKLFRKRIGETEYTLSLLPIGGYVKMAGDNPEQVSDAPWEFLAQPAWKRVTIILAGPVMNIVLAFLLYLLIFSVWGRERAEFEIGGFMEESPAREAGVLPGDRIIAVDGVAADDIAHVSEMIAYSDPDRPVNLEIIRGDSTVSLPVPTRELQPGRRMIGIQFRPSYQNVVGAVKWKGAAWKTGLSPGDEILSVSGEELTVNDQLIFKFAGKHDTEVPITWLRDGVEKHGVIVPEPQPFYPELEEGVPFPDLGLIGYTPREQLTSGTLVPAALERTRDSCFLLLQFLGALAKGAPGTRDAVGGPVAIFVIIWESARYGFYHFLLLVSLISVNLGIFNLLPIPVLDGGHLVIIFIEGVIRRPLSLRVKAAIQQAGLFILLALILAITWKDLLKFR